MKWWKYNKDKFPLMSKAVRAIYCIPASSSSSERAFSVGGLICSQRRGKLSPKKIEELAIIKLNHSAVKSYKEKYGGCPKMDFTPNQDDFVLEEVTDDEEDHDEDAFDLEYEELTEESEDKQDLVVLSDS